MKTATIPHRIRLRTHATTLLALLASLQAQQTTPPKPAEDPVQLSPFQVTTDKDIGYGAANSLAGGRTDTPLRLIPSAVSAITAEFMDDLALNTITDSLFWTLNAAPDNLRQQETIFGDYSYNFRGTGGGGTVPTRNYFQFYAVSDTYNVERFEFARGPNSIVYGDAQLGGQPTTWTKIPRNDREIRSAQFRVDSYGGYRTSFDVNQRLGKNASARVNSVFQRNKDWRDGIKQDREAIHLAARYRLGPKTELRAETEWNKEVRLTYSINNNDQSSYWTGRAANSVDANAIPAAERAAAGVGLVSTAASYFVVMPGMPQEARYLDWKNSFWSTGTGAALMATPRADIPNAPTLPSKKFTLQPPDGTASENYQATTVWLDHRFSSNLESQFSYFYFDDLREAKTTELFNARRVDVNRLLPNGQTNPKFGVPFSEAAVGRQPQERTVNEVRGLASVRLATNWAGLDLRQRFTTAAGRRWFNHELRSYFQRWVNNPATADLTQSVNVTRYRLYWDEPRKYPVMPLPNIPGVDIQYRQIFFNQHNDDVLDYAQLVSNTTLWGERISLLGGARYDAFDRETNTAVQTATGARYLNPAINQTGHATTYSGGAVIYPLKSQKWLGAYFNFSQNFAPPSAGLPRFDGTPFGPTRGEGFDYGLRFNLLEGRIYASLNRYQSKQEDRIVGTNANALRGIWRAYGVTTEIDATRFNIDFRDTESLSADGYEFEVTASPSKKLRLTAGVSFPDTAVVDRLADTKKYNALYRPVWLQALATGRGEGGVALATNELNSLRNNLDALDQTLQTTVAGVRLNNTLKYSGHFYGTYRFDEGLLRDVSAGAGAYYRGPEKIGNVDPQILFNTSSPTTQQRAESAFAYLYARSYYHTTAHLAYERKFGRYRTKFQLNIDNLLDDDRVRFYGVVNYRPGGIGTNPLTQIPGNFNYPPPRKLSFTTTVGF